MTTYQIRDCLTGQMLPRVYTKRPTNRINQLNKAYGSYRYTVVPNFGA